jgi:hypothetical protein
MLLDTCGTVLLVSRTSIFQSVDVRLDVVFVVSISPAISNGKLENGVRLSGRHSRIRQTERVSR